MKILLFSFTNIKYKTMKSKLKNILRPKALKKDFIKMTLEFLFNPLRETHPTKSDNKEKNITEAQNQFFCSVKKEK